MNFSLGTGLSDYKYVNKHVRAVRGGFAISRFKDNGDGTVTDKDTDLMWQQTTAPNSMNWQNALSYCANLTLGEYDDWRLPNIRELASLADRTRLAYTADGTRYAPAIDTGYFPDTVLSGNFYGYWSSTTRVFVNPRVAWAFLFIHPRTYTGDTKLSSFYVRAVRTAQSDSEGCVSDFSASQNKGVAPLIVNFTDQSTGTTDYWNWSFGDGSTSTIQNPSHTYTEPGTYKVSLNVTCSRGTDTNIKNNYIKVRSPAKAMPWIPLLLTDY